MDVDIWSRDGELFNAILIEGVPHINLSPSNYRDYNSMSYPYFIFQTVFVIKHQNAKIYTFEGKIHREDGPARIWDGGYKKSGGESWWFQGEKHRNPYDGPAHLSSKIQPPNPQIFYCIKGNRYDEKEHACRIWDMVMR